MADECYRLLKRTPVAAFQERSVAIGQSARAFTIARLPSRRVPTSLVLDRIAYDLRATARSRSLNIVDTRARRRFEQELYRFRCRLHTGAQVETKKRTLRDGACRKPMPLDEPCRRTRVQAVFGRCQAMRTLES